jgi:hypothetical protein
LRTLLERRRPGALGVKTTVSQLAALARMESVIPALAELGTAVEILEAARPYDLAGLVPATAR